MEYNPLNVTLFLDCIAFVLSIQLVYYNIKFNTEKKFDTLAFLTAVVTFSAVLEAITYWGYMYYPEYDECFRVLEFLSVLFYCVIYASFFKFVYERVSFVPKLSGKILNLAVAAIYSVAVIFSLLSEEKNYFVGGSFQLDAAKNAVYDAQMFMAYLLIVYCVVFVVLAIRRKDFVAINVAVAGILVLVFGLFVRLIMLFTLGDMKYASNALIYSLSFTFVYLMFNTIELHLKKDREHIIKADMDIATGIQLGALPRKLPAYPGHKEIDLRTSIKAAREIGGDFYDYFDIDEDRVAFVIADVSGKGLPAALFMMNAKNIIKAAAGMTDDTSCILSYANKLLSRKNNTKMFVTVWMGIYDTKTGCMQYTNAGHNPPVVTHADGSVTVLDSVHGTVVGTVKSAVYSSGGYSFCEGDRLFLYTDGLTDAHNEKDEMFEMERVIDILRSAISESCENTLKIMEERVEDFSRNAPQFDDITMMALRFDDRT